MFPDFSGIVRLAMFGLFVGIPMTIWKLIDIAIWICRHVSVSWN